MTPVVAHPERNAAVARNPAFLRGLVSRGMLVQVTADSVTGRFGREARRLALFLLGEGLAHFVASDAHSAADRAPVLAPALREVERRLGKEVRDYLLENARYVAEGQGVSEKFTLKKVPPKANFFFAALAKLKGRQNFNFLFPFLLIFFQGKTNK